MRRARSLLPAILLVFVAAAAAAQDAGAIRGTLLPNRPDPEGVSTRVSLGFLFVDVVEVSDLRQEFTADIFFRMQWRDARLALPAEAADRGQRRLPLESVWHPQPGALNRRQIDRLLPDVVTIDADGLVTYSQRVYGTFAAPMDLRRFPADAQTLAVEIASYRYSTSEVEFEIQPLGGLLGEPTLTGWSVEVGEHEIAPITIGGSGASFAAATFQLVATRDVVYYYLTMSLPLVLIALMAWAVFWIDPTLLPPQFAISTASVFSLIAFRFSLKLSLPRISYLTDMDRIVLAVTVLVFAAFGHVVMVGRFAKTGREDLARKLDRWGRWSYLVALGVLVLTLVV